MIEDFCKFSLPYSLLLQFLGIDVLLLPEFQSSSVSGAMLYKSPAGYPVLNYELKLRCSFHN
ncbi:MAG: hypothetical protein DMG61_03235 [Acidobacteria bacterium]|nr:MAG: hypothetical protein DMG61_03235 [Acidobacteriota bacterium]